MATPTANALDILIDALPTSQASSLEQQLSISIQTQSSNSISTTPQSSSISSTLTSSTTSTSSTSSQFSSTSSQSSRLSSSTTVSSSSSASSQATAAPTAAPQSSKSAGEIAGIVTGSVAGFILILVAIFLLLRYRQKRNGPRNGSGTSSLLGSIIGRREKVYPEVAWLYDPVRPTTDARPGQEPLRNPVQGGRPSQEPLRPSMAIRRPSEESAPRMGANAPWSSRPSTGNEQFDQQDTNGLPHITQQSPLGPSIFQPPRSRSASHSNVQGYYIPAQPRHHDEEHGDEVISPLLPPPVQQSRYVTETPVYNSNGYGQIPMRSAMRSPANGRTQAMANVGMHDGTGRAF